MKIKLTLEQRRGFAEDKHLDTLTSQWLKLHDPDRPATPQQIATIKRLCPKWTPPRTYRAARHALKKIHSLAARTAPTTKVSRETQTATMQSPSPGIVKGTSSSPAEVAPPTGRPHGRTTEQRDSLPDPLVPDQGCKFSPG